MKLGTEVIYYSQKQRDKYPNLEELWNQKAEIGKVEELSEGRLRWVRVDGEAIPMMYVRIARQVSWYSFWRKRGFNRNLYWYLFVIIFFIVFIR